MKRLLYPALVLVALVLAAACVAAPPEKGGCPASVRDRIRAASVSVWAERGKGSGTLLRDAEGESWVVTATHVVREAKFVKVAQVESREDGGQVTRWAFAEVTRADPVADIAILRVGRGLFIGYARAYIGPTPGADTPVYHCGSHLGDFHQSLTKGEVQRVGAVKIDGCVRDQADITLFPGGSGGGFFTTDGKWIGMLTHGAGDRLALFVPVRSVRAWATRQGLEFGLTGRATLPKGPALRELLPMPRR